MTDPNDGREGGTPATRVDALQRDRVVEQLCAHFANDRLSVDELEHRLDRAYKATTVGELQQLLADLPATPIVPAGTVAPVEVPARGRISVVLSSQARRGGWLVPRHLQIRAILGSAEIDLREATFAAGVTEIEVSAVLGAVEIIVPTGVRVECLGSALLGSFESDGEDLTATLAGVPIIRLTGSVLLASVEARHTEARQQSAPSTTRLPSRSS